MKIICPSREPGIIVCLIKLKIRESIVVLVRFSTIDRKRSQSGKRSYKLHVWKGRDYYHRLVMRA